MSFIISIIVGGIAGWLAGQIMGSRFSVLGNIIIGVIGVGTFWIRASPFSLYFSLVLLISSSNTEPRRPLDDHVGI